MVIFTGTGKGNAVASPLFSLYLSENSRIFFKFFPNVPITFIPLFSKIQTILAKNMNFLGTVCILYLKVAWSNPAHNNQSNIRTTCKV